MRAVVIGGTGHIGSWLAPGLARAGHDVVSISRGTRAPYHQDEAWSDVEQVTCDREAAEADATMCRLQTMPGIGPITASVLVATLPDVSAFRTSRDLSA